MEGLVQQVFSKNHRCSIGNGVIHNKFIMNTAARQRNVLASEEKRVEILAKQERSFTDPEAQTNDPPSTTMKKAKKSLGSFFKTAPLPASSFVQLSQAVEAEFNSYLLSPPIDSEGDPLVWQKLHQITFPQLRKLARKYLCIPASSSPSERLFGTPGNITTVQLGSSRRPTSMTQTNDPPSTTTKKAKKSLGSFFKTAPLPASSFVSGNITTCQHTCIKPCKVNMLGFSF
ncbi:uncharacterized protein LOC124880605 [Girardinichthys multiradiatus]|uniref:uncharacterized protein LOC124880605 n=1 Tax=Girardinichthys multiradiatus TaxID=208333 RepID=UPI001FABD05B|nr:uncharacterized protein LOC124880605 [Girardinichthys multiradiatus]